MKKCLKNTTLLLCFCLVILSPISSQNITPTIENIYNNDFVFRVLGVQEAVTGAWQKYDYIIPGYVAYRTTETNELKLFFKDQIITYEFGPPSEIKTEVNTSGQAIMLFGANAINMDTGINCRLVMAYVSGTDQLTLIITSIDNKPITGYVIKFGL